MERENDEDNSEKIIELFDLVESITARIKQFNHSESVIEAANK